MALLTVGTNLMDLLLLQGVYYEYHQSAFIAL